MTTTPGKCKKWKREKNDFVIKLNGGHPDENTSCETRTPDCFNDSSISQHF